MTKSRLTGNRDPKLSPGLTPCDDGPTVPFSAPGPSVFPRPLTATRSVPSDSFVRAGRDLSLAQPCQRSPEEEWSRRKGDFERAQSRRRKRQARYDGRQARFRHTALAIQARLTRSLCTLQARLECTCDRSESPRSSTVLLLVVSTVARGVVKLSDTRSTPSTSTTAARDDRAKIPQPDTRDQDCTAAVCCSFSRYRRRGSRTRSIPIGSINPPNSLLEPLHHLKHAEQHPDYSQEELPADPDPSAGLPSRERGRLDSTLSGRLKRTLPGPSTRNFIGLGDTSRQFSLSHLLSADHEAL